MANQKHCRNCGAENLPTDMFCTNCGSAFVSAPASPSHTAATPAPSPLSQQPPYSPPPQPQRRFKKRYILYGLVVLILLGVVASAFSGFSGTLLSPSTASASATAPAAQKASATPKAQAPTATPAPPSGSNVFDGMEFQAKSVSNPPQALGSAGNATPEPGNVYVAFCCTVKNVNAPTDSNPIIGLSYWQLRDKAGNVYNAKWLTSETPGIKTFLSVDSKPGDVASGYVFFEVPANHGAWTSLVYDDGGRNVTITL